MSASKKCENCNQTVSQSGIYDVREIWFCSETCRATFYDREAETDREASEWGAKVNQAIKKGEAESGKTFADAGDGLIMSWIDSASE